VKAIHSLLIWTEVLKICFNNDNIYPCFRLSIPCLLNVTAFSYNQPSTAQKITTVLILLCYHGDMKCLSLENDYHGFVRHTSGQVFRNKDEQIVLNLCNSDKSKNPEKNIS
jgi:hypothetical protein